MSETRTALEPGTAQLRPIREEDAPDLQCILSDPRVYEPTNYDVLDLEGTRAIITKWLANERAGVARRWAVVGVQGVGFWGQLHTFDSAEKPPVLKIH